jgi:hypothetical protein
MLKIGIKQINNIKKFVFLYALFFPVVFGIGVDEVVVIIGGVVVEFGSGLNVVVCGVSVIVVVVVVPGKYVVCVAVVVVVPDIEVACGVVVVVVDSSTNGFSETFNLNLFKSPIPLTLT